MARGSGGRSPLAIRTLRAPLDYPRLAGPFPCPRWLALQQRAASWNLLGKRTFVTIGATLRLALIRSGPSRTRSAKRRGEAQKRTTLTGTWAHGGPRGDTLAVRHGAVSYTG
jgi:hypothetical protein